MVPGQHPKNRGQYPMKTNTSNNFNPKGKTYQWKIDWSYGKKIFIPEGCRAYIFKILHHGHQGITKTLQNARQSVYWHRITRNVQEMCSKCQECQKLRPSTLKEDDFPNKLFDVVSADICYVDKQVYMVYTDGLSEYPLVTMWYKNPNIGQVIKVMQQYFSLFGKPLEFKSDGGSQFDSMEMRKFLEEYGIDQGQSSPYNPQSNGHAERNVNILKDLLMKTDNDVNSEQFLDGISQIRNTPRADGISPC